MSDKTLHTDRHLLLAFYDTDTQARNVLERLVEADYPLDQLSLLGKASSSGDDPLGVYYPSSRERVLGWGRLGAFWGAVLGMISGAAGMFVLPGLGAMMLIGPIAEALAGAAIGGGLMAGGAALSEVAVTIHRMGVPEDALESIEQRLRDGQYLLLLIAHTSELERWQRLLRNTGADEQWTFPYYGLPEVAATLVGD